MCPLTSSNVMGFFPPSAAYGDAAYSLNTAGWRLGLSVPILASNKTINTFSCQLQSVVGSPIAANISCSIYADDGVNGQPSGSALATAPANSIPSANSFMDFTFNYTMTASTQYWFVIRNLNATPGTNYFRIVASNGASQHPMFMPSALFGFSTNYSTDSGSTWPGIDPGTIPLWFCAFSDSTNSGTRILAFTTASDIAGAAKEWGMAFTTPTGGKLKVKGGTFQAAAYGTVPIKTSVFKIYKGTSLVATSVASNVTGGANPVAVVSAWFDAEVALDSGTLYRITLAVPSVNGTTNYMGCNGIITVEDSVLAKSLKPFNGSVSYTTTANSGTSFTDTDTKFPCYGIMLDPANEIDPGSQPNSDPGIANVRSGTTYTVASATVTGTLDLPAVAAVKTGTVFDNTTKTGTYDASDRWTAIAPADVRASTAYKSNSLTNNQTGTLTSSVKLS